jgi:hypothetical protein
MEKSVVKRETHDEALVRLAKQARDRGVQLFRVVTTGEVFATSISRPGELHRVTHLSCDCPGFIRHQRCMHYAKLMDSLDWLPVVESASSPVPCTACDATGRVWLEGSWSADECWYCRGSDRADVVADRIGPVADNIIPFPVDRPRPAA